MKRLVLALALLTLPVAAPAQDLSAEEAAAIDKSVTEVLDQTGVPSAQVAIVRGGMAVWNASRIIKHHNHRPNQKAPPVSVGMTVRFPAAASSAPTRHPP